jgi:hypothetical protein
VKHLLIGENIFMGDEINAFFRHAIGAPQITPVCYGKPQIIDGPFISIFEFFFFYEFHMITVSWNPVKNPDQRSRLLHENRCPCTSPLS